MTNDATMKNQTTATEAENRAGTNPAEPTPKELQASSQPRRTGMPRNRSSILLMTLLAGQFVIAGALFWQSQRGATFDVADTLVSVDTDSIDHIELQDKDNSIVLQKNDSTWLLPGENKFPADVTRIQSLLDTIRQIKPGLPVATTVASRAQLDVADDDYQRHMTLTSGDQTVADIFIGSSPGFRKAHLRVAKDDAIYAARVNVYDIPVTNNDWLDKNLLAMNNITRITGPDYTLLKSDGSWSLENKAKDNQHELDTAIVDKLLNTLQGLQVQALIDNNAAQASKSTADSDTKEAIALTIRYAGGENGFTLSKQDTTYSVTGDKWPFASFSLSEQQFNSIADATLEKLTIAGSKANKKDKQNQTKN